MLSFSPSTSSSSFFLNVNSPTSYQQADSCITSSTAGVPVPWPWRERFKSRSSLQQPLQPLLFCHSGIPQLCTFPVGIAVVSLFFLIPTDYLAFCTKGFFFFFSFNPCTSRYGDTHCWSFVKKDSSNGIYQPNQENASSLINKTLLSKRSEYLHRQEILHQTPNWLVTDYIFTRGVCTTCLSTGLNLHRGNLCQNAD